MNPRGCPTVSYVIEKLPKGLAGCSWKSKHRPGLMTLGLIQQPLFCPYWRGEIHHPFSLNRNLHPITSLPAPSHEMESLSLTHTSHTPTAGTESEEEIASLVHAPSPSRCGSGNFSEVTPSVVLTQESWREMRSLALLPDPLSRNSCRQDHFSSPFAHACAFSSWEEP